ncbi:MULTISPECIES: hypothetical protein [unclassified Streptomyces]|uniref:hypothetical protein n=1 Tax=unclassified Streptomyces TaxID=2593676 RepID=UPI001660D7B4|nr:MULTISPECIES: hypothetical protein [unclassified Streptomyces]MBD0706939.1 hypothetical protein [Streptomyces sp. CBMA291]MBD0716610.1 hypothetical protein [Streptomyces sp. CBMA370]
MVSHRKLRAAAVVCAVVVVAGPAPVAAWAAPATAPATAPVAAPTAPAPSPDPFAGLTAGQIADRAIAATRSATSLRMAGRVVTGGQPLDIDFAIDGRGQCDGTMRIKGGLAELRRTDGATYLKGDEGFWHASMASQGMSPAQIAATVELVKGRWLKITPGQAGSGDLGGVCDLSALLGGGTAQRRALTRGPDTEVGGVPAATLVARGQGGTTTTLSVALEGRPYLLRMTKTGGGSPGTLVFSAYGKPVHVAVPPASQTVDLARLEQGATPA